MSLIVANVSGNYRKQGFTISISPNSSDEIPMIFPYDITLMCIWLTVKEINTGDVIDGYFTFVPLPLISNINSGVTEIPVNQLILKIINIGFELQIKKLEDNSINNVGEVIAINKENSTITVQTATTQTFSSGDHLIFKVRGLKNITLNTPGLYMCNQAPFNAQLMYQLGKLSVVYTNNSNNSKDFYYELEYYY